MTFGRLGTGTGMDNSIPEIRERKGNGKKHLPKVQEREGNEKKPFPKFGNGKGMKKIHSHISGMGIRGYHSQEWRPLIPFPNFGNGFFSFPSRSRISGMDFFHSLPVPEFREWIFSIPFPFPNFGNGFFPFPSRSRIDPFKVGNQKGKWEILRDASIPTFSASCTFHTIYMPSIC